MIAYSEPCRICDLQRRFSFGARDQSWSLKSFCVAEFYQSMKRDRESFWHRRQKEDRVSPLLVLARELYTFSVGYYSNQKKVSRL